ncbi:hypothetical protein [Microlunatus sp. GCM10028923]|uniref:hypothetical protein n=1 Tax=Microlunatus sp. GCM10028923 TaxID=3273400 RepID=UPI003617B932
MDNSGYRPGYGASFDANAAFQAAQQAHRAAWNNNHRASGGGGFLSQLIGLAATVFAIWVVTQVATAVYPGWFEELVSWLTSQS